MSKAVTCPVCFGTGKVTKQTVGTAGGTFEVDCHGCGGKGWVEIADNMSSPSYPYPYYLKPWYPIVSPYVPPGTAYDLWKYGEYCNE